MLDVLSKSGRIALIRRNLTQRSLLNARSTSAVDRPTTEVKLACDTLNALTLLMMHRTVHSSFAGNIK
jgi:hypothetical protein